jgi:hypothetical protein
MIVDKIDAQFERMAIGEAAGIHEMAAFLRFRHVQPYRARYGFDQPGIGS